MIVYHSHNLAAFAGNHIFYWAAQLFSVIVAPGSVSPGLNLRIKLASVVLLATGDLTPPTTAVDTPWEMEGYFTVRSIGPTGTVVANGKYDNGQTKGLLANAGTKTIDADASNEIHVSVEWAIANALNTVKVQQLIVKKYNG